MTTLAATFDEPVRFKAPKLPQIKMSFEDTLKFLRWSNSWPHVDPDDRPEYVKALWWKVRIS